MQYRLTRYSIKLGYESKVEDFLRTVNEQSAEVLEILNEGEISLDCSFTEVTDSRMHLYIFLRLRSLETTVELLENSSSALYSYIESAVGDFTESRVSMFTRAAFDVLPK